MHPLFSIAIIASCLFGQMSAQTNRVIAFWNLENLYDTLDDPLKNDNDFLPEGPQHWTGERYRHKLDHLAEVIAQLGAPFSKEGPVLLGVCEAENARVIADLLANRTLSARRYKFVLIEGPDARGVDPALIYDSIAFHVTSTRSFPVRVVTDTLHRTRDLLLVCGKMDGENIAVLVNHWPSRRGGEVASLPNRISAAKTARRIIDSLVHTDPSPKVIAMGDFNDDPVSESIKKYFGTYGSADHPVEGKYFNPMETPYKKGIGTLAWQDTWNLFDQIIISTNWTSATSGKWRYKDVRIFNPDFLRADHGNFKGYPNRTYSGGKYTGGYSDHFPSYVVISK